MKALSPVIPRIMQKEFTQAVRDKRMLGVMLVAPVLQVVLFGYAVNLDLTAQPTVVADLDHSEASRDAVRVLARAESFRLVGVVETDDAAEQMLARGEVAMSVLIPRGFEERRARGDAEVLVLVDGADSNTALRASQEASQLLNAPAMAAQRERLQLAASSVGLAADVVRTGLEIEARPWFNPEMKTAIFLVPAVLALVLMIITMVLTAMGLTREKEIGTLEQIMVTPVRPIELMIGKTVPFACIGLLDVAVIVSVAAVVFDVPVRGSMLALFGASALFLMTTLGLGLFISTVSGTQQQAMMNAFFLLMPALMLSGYIFPLENMPRLVQWLTVVNPLRYYIALTRGIMIKGAGLADLWQETLTLAALGLLVLVLAAARFKKRIA